MMRTYNIYWWNRKEGTHSEEMNVIVVTDSFDKVLDIFRKGFPNNPVEFIQSIEPGTAKVIIG